jgi:hypothetical protein
MAADEDQEEGTARSRRKPSDVLPFGRFWWKEWVGDPAIRRLSRDMRGALADVRAFTYGTKTPGVMDEEDVRAWAGYSPKEWTEVRDVFSKAFKTTRRRGRSTWILKDIVEDHEASMRVYLRSVDRAMKGVAGRRRGKDLATTGTTTGATAGSPQVALAVEPTVQPQVDKTLEVRGSELRTKKTDQPESDSRAARAQTARSRAGSAGSAGSSRQSRLEPIVAAALGTNPNPPANGGSA